MNKKLIMGLGLIGCIFIGSYGVMNNKMIALTFNQHSNSLIKTNFNYEVYETIFTTTKGLVKPSSKDYKAIGLLPKETLEYYSNYILSDTDVIVLENLNSWLNGNFSNIVEFRNQLDQLMNAESNQITEADYDAIDAYKEYLGL